jgi:hypothetical protein
MAKRGKYKLRVGRYATAERGTSQVRHIDLLKIFIVYLKGATFAAFVP